MATHALKSPVTRETSAYVRERSRMRAVMVSVGASSITLRAKGMRGGYTLDIVGLYHQAVRGEASRILAERKAKKKAKKEGRR